MNKKQLNPKLKPSIFKTINSKDKAYWLGFISADGCVSRNRIQFCISTKDEDHLNKFINFIGGNVLNKRYYPNQWGNDRVFYAIYNKTMFNDLLRKGIVSPKSKNLQLPNLKRSLLLSFLMGYFDGDGSESSTEIHSGSKFFLNQIQNKFNLPFKIKKRRNHIGSVMTLTLGASLFREMMLNYTDSLPRKRKTCKEDKGIKTKKSQGIQVFITQPSRRKFEVSKKDLEKLIRTHNNFSLIGRLFNVSDNAIRKRCRILGIKT